MDLRADLSKRTGANSFNLLKPGLSKPGFHQRTTSVCCDCAKLFPRRTGAISVAGRAQARKQLFRHWMSPWFRPGIQLKICSAQTNDGPAPRKHPQLPGERTPRRHSWLRFGSEQIACPRREKGMRVQEPQRGRVNPIHRPAGPSFVSILIRLGARRPIPCKSMQIVSR